MKQKQLEISKMINEIESMYKNYLKLTQLSAILNDKKSKQILHDNVNNELKILEEKWTKIQKFKKRIPSIDKWKNEVLEIIFVLS